MRRDVTVMSILELVSEFDRLDTKIMNQRTELRRLNRTIRSMWEGVRFSHKVRTDMLITAMMKEVARLELKKPTYKIEAQIPFNDKHNSTTGNCEEERRPAKCTLR